MSIDLDPIAELTATIKRQREFAAQARADLIAATPALLAAIRHHSGQSLKIEKILWALWNNENPTSLCDALSGLDTDLAVAVLSMIAARAHGGGEADDIFRTIIDQSGSQPPIHPAQ